MEQKYQGQTSVAQNNDMKLNTRYHVTSVLHSEIEKIFSRNRLFLIESSGSRKWLVFRWLRDTCGILPSLNSHLHIPMFWGKAEHLWGNEMGTKEGPFQVGKIYRFSMQNGLFPKTWRSFSWGQNLGSLSKGGRNCFDDKIDGWSERSGFLLLSFKRGFYRP